MEITKNEKLEKIREEIRLGEERIEKTKKAHEEKMSRLQEQFKEKLTRMLEQQKERQERLKAASASQVISDVGELELTPEELKKILNLFAEGKLSALMEESERNEILSKVKSEAAFEGDLVNEEMEE